MKRLVFAPAGTVQLLASKAKNAHVVWSSDDDEEFAEEFDDVLDPNSEDEVGQLTDYLVDQELIEEGEEIEIEEQYFDDGPGDDDEDDDDFDVERFDPSGSVGYVSRH
jgi:hypothetical protein